MQADEFVNDGDGFYRQLFVGKSRSISKKRIWELDFLRGIALLLMIYFHFVYDLKEIYGYKVEYSSGFNQLTGKAAGILFIFISGISCSLSRNNLKRGIRVLAVALMLSLATWLYSPKFVILFGILHFLAICMMLSIYFIKLKMYQLFGIGALILALATVVSKIRVSYNYLFIFGICSNKFVSADYYPLIPWLGIFLYGIAIGKLVYSRKRSIFTFNAGENFVSSMGRNTLICYLLHQPVIMGIITLVKYLL
jgi:uncharacterized membrane protein